MSDQVKLVSLVTSTFVLISGGFWNSDVESSSDWCLHLRYAWLALMSPSCEACRDPRAPKSHPLGLASSYLAQVLTRVLTSRQHRGSPTPQGPRCNLTSASRRWLLLPPSSFFFFSCFEIHAGEKKQCVEESRVVKECFSAFIFSWFNFLFGFSLSANYLFWWPFL